METAAARPAGRSAALRIDAAVRRAHRVLASAAGLTFVYGVLVAAGLGLSAPAAPGPDLLAVGPVTPDTPGLSRLETTRVAEAAARVAGEQRCLALALYYEARGEGRTGQMAVADVIVRRAADRDGPGSICGVVFAGAQRATGCQFSFTCGGVMRPRKADQRAWAKARRLAAEIVRDPGALQALDLTREATHFHAVDVAPLWADAMIRTVQIGNHVFYREPRRTRGS